jgi:hypothetical protein
MVGFSRMVGFKMNSDVTSYVILLDNIKTLDKNQRGNQEWKIPRQWQHWTHKTQDENKQNKAKHNTGT